MSKKENKELKKQWVKYLKDHREWVAKYVRPYLQKLQEAEDGPETQDDDSGGNPPPPPPPNPPGTGKG